MSNSNGTATAQTPKAKPVFETRLGRIKASVWANQTEAGIRHNVTISRLYKDDSGWQTSTSFGRDDLPLVAKIADRCLTWIFEHSSDGQPGNGQQPHGDQPRSAGHDPDVPF